MIKSAFPIQIGNYKINRDLSTEEYNYLDNLEMTDNQHNHVSIDTYVLEKLTDLKKDLQTIVDTYVDEVFNLPKNAQIYITQSWTNHTNQGQKHHKHFHWNSLVSGVFYIDVEPMRDAIEFWNNTQPFFDFNKDGSCWFPAEPNGVFLFPSYLEHSVRTIESGKTRKSLAFNTFVKGELGSINHLTHLKL